MGGIRSDLSTMIADWKVAQDRTYTRERQVEDTLSSFSSTISALKSSGDATRDLVVQERQDRIRREADIVRDFGKVR